MAATPAMPGMAASAPPVRALIFDMDGTMIDSMPHHRQSWIAFAAQHGLTVGVDDLMRRTTGRTGIACMRDLFNHPEMDEALVRQTRRQMASALF